MFYCCVPVLIFSLYNRGPEGAAEGFFVVWVVTCYLLTLSTVMTLTLNGQELLVCGPAGVHLLVTLQHQRGTMTTLHTGSSRFHKRC